MGSRASVQELKQTLQLQDFYGENENAVRWQIWAALLTHLMLRFLKFKAKANCSYTRFVGFVRAVVWLKKDLMSVLRAYGIAPGGNQVIHSVGCRIYWGLRAFSTPLLDSRMPKNRL